MAGIDFSETSGRDCIAVVVLKNYEPELLYILADLPIMCLKEFCFRELWKVSSVVSLYECLGKVYNKYFHPVSLLPVVAKICLNLEITDLLITSTNAAFLLINSIVLGLLFQLQIVASNNIAIFLNRPGTTQAVALDTSKAFDEV